MTTDQIHPSRDALSINNQALIDENTRLRQTITELRETIAAERTPTRQPFSTDALAATVHAGHIGRIRSEGLATDEGYPRAWETLAEDVKDAERATVTAVLAAINSTGYILLERVVYDRNHTALRAATADLKKIREILVPAGADPEIPMAIGDVVAPAIRWLVNDRNAIRAHRNRLAEDSLDRHEATALAHRIRNAPGVPPRIRAALDNLLTQIETAHTTSPLAAYTGRWVAMKNGSVIGDAVDLTDLITHLRDTDQTADKTFHVVAHDAVGGR